jgi:hypothetical protein
MITASTLEVLTTYSPQYLTRAAQNAGYRGPNFTSSKFLGITNGGQFCYMAVFQVEGGTDSTKIFLTYIHAEDRVIADYHLTETF